MWSIVSTCVYFSLSAQLIPYHTDSLWHHKPSKTQTHTRVHTQLNEMKLDAWATPPAATAGQRIHYTQASLIPSLVERRGDVLLKGAGRVRGTVALDGLGSR